LNWIECKGKKHTLGSLNLGNVSESFGTNFITSKLTNNVFGRASQPSKYRSLDAILRGLGMFIKTQEFSRIRFFKYENSVINTKI